MGWNVYILFGLLLYIHMKIKNFLCIRTADGFDRLFYVFYVFSLISITCHGNILLDNRLSF